MLVYILTTSIFRSALVFIVFPFKIYSQMFTRPVFWTTCHYCTHIKVHKRRDMPVHNLDNISSFKSLWLKPYAYQNMVPTTKWCQITPCLLTLAIINQSKCKYKLYCNGRYCSVSLSMHNSVYLNLAPTKPTLFDYNNHLFLTWSVFDKDLLRPNVFTLQSVVYYFSIAVSNIKKQCSHY